jgi:hypothetical protein
MGDGVLSKVNLAVTIVLAVVAGLAKCASDHADAKLKELDGQLKKQEARLNEAQEHRAERESVQKVQLEVYQLVVASLEHSKPEMQRVAVALVTTVLDEPLRGSLLAALGTAGAPEVASEARKTIASENKFRADELLVQQSQTSAEASPGKAFDWQNIDYDVFWCERSGEAARRTATAIVERLKKEGARGRLRVRALPDSINARPGYQHSGYVIRRNAGEETQARELKRVGDSVMGGADTFQISLSAQATPWYLSAFVCPGA